MLDTRLVTTFLAAACLLAAPVAARAQATGVAAFVETLAQAEARMAAKDYKAAAALFEQVVAVNPVQPQFWQRLAEAHYNAQAYKEAIRAYEKLIELGGGPPGNAAYNVACCYALLGDKDRAIQWLERALAVGFPSLGYPPTDEDLKAVHDDPRFKKMLGLADVSSMSRTEGWRYDLAILAGEARRKGFGVPRKVTREAFDRRVRALHDAIPRLTDDQIPLELTKLVVSLGDGHSTVFGSKTSPLYVNTLPLQFYLFEEGLFVISGAPEHKALLGAQVLAFDGRRTAVMMEALVPYVNRDRENAVWPKQTIPYRLRQLPLLHVAGLVRDPRRVALTVRDLSGVTRDVVVGADTTQPNIWNTLPNPPEWVNLASSLGTAVPLYLKSMDKPYWFEHLPDSKTLYFQFNSVRNDETERLDRFTERLFKFIAENDVLTLVVDMRWNNGGNTYLSQPLIRALVANQKINQNGRLFVVIGRRTYSAAQNTATSIERYTNAIFVGEPTGSSPNFVGEEDPVVLPYSKITANISNLYWQSSWPTDERMWIAPQVYTPPTFAAFQAGRDLALEAILEVSAATRKGR